MTDPQKQFISALTIAISNCSLYAKEHELIEESAKKTFALFNEFLDDLTEMMLIENELVINRVPVRDARLHSTNLVKHLKKKGVSRVDFVKGITAAEVKQFITDIATPAVVRRVGVPPGRLGRRGASSARGASPAGEAGDPPRRGGEGLPGWTGSLAVELGELLLEVLDRLGDGVGGHGHGQGKAEADLGRGRLVVGEAGDLLAAGHRDEAERLGRVVLDAEHLGQHHSRACWSPWNTMRREVMVTDPVSTAARRSSPCWKVPRVAPTR